MAEVIKTELTFTGATEDADKVYYLKSSSDIIVHTNENNVLKEKLGEECNTADAINHLASFFSFADVTVTGTGWAKQTTGTYADKYTNTVTVTKINNASTGDIALALNEDGSLPSEAQKVQYSNIEYAVCDTDTNSIIFIAEDPEVIDTSVNFRLRITGCQ